MGMGTGGGGDRTRPMSDINVTPLVDIMLVLLIIFMVTAPLMTQGVEVKLPEATADPLTSNQEPLMVSVGVDGTAALEGKPITLAQLAARLQVIKQGNPHLVVYVRGDNRADYGAVMRVMAHLQQAGVTEVGLVTEPPAR
ncbi:MAG: protein TolR [Magnetococcales bacterium]|nr:protein TolR [Magnetococcales bacterium]